ncbi:MAG: FG-GAP repeat protein [Alphaproteobacteria bacterium]|nr:FG-GAP repeat protein [Alphaproteobacteria bacterium]
MTRPLALTSILFALAACAATSEDVGPRVIDLAAQPGADEWPEDATPDNWEPLIGASASWYARWRGESASDRFGICVVDGGDFNGDGDHDIMLGSLWGSGSASGDGAAFSIFGPANGVAAQTTGMSLRLMGSNSSKAGQVIGAGGDVTGDGQDDLIAGAVADSTIASNAGAAYVVAGGINGENDFSSVGMQFTGLASGDRVGQAVDIMGDLNNDGVADIGITGSGVNDTTNFISDAGAAYLFYGPITAGASVSDADVTIYGNVASQQLGTRISGIGDHDGDGIDDMVVTARYDATNGTDAGAAFIFTSEADATTVADADATILGTDDNDALGNQINDSPFDINQDGFNDLLIGALGAGAEGKGEAYVFYGPLSGTVAATDADIRFFGQQIGDQFGASLAAGDMDEDGDVDIFVGANRQTTIDRGAGYIYLDPAPGVISGSDADVIIWGSATNAYFGSWAAVVPGTDASDGGDLLVVGESNRGNGSFPQRGIVYLFSLPL